MTLEPNAARPFRWVPAVAVLATAWLALFPITSVDAYYHLAVGRYILEHRGIPDTAVFSGTFAGRPWHDNEWGFQVVAAALGRAERAADGTLHLTRAGTIALIGLRAGVLAATLALLSAAMALAGVDRLTRGVGVVLSAFLTFNNLFWTVRPQILTYLAVAALIWLLAADRAGRRGVVWLALPLVALWANVHGAFIVGVVLLGAEAAGSLLDRDGRFRRLAAVTLLAPAAACLNPHGWHQVVHPFLYVARPEIHAGNAEWTRPDFLHLPLLLSTVAALAVATVAAGRPKWTDLLRAVAFLGLLTTAIRHLPLAALVVVPALAATATRAAARGGWRVHLLPTGPAWGRPALRSYAAVGLSVAIVVLSGARFVGPVPRFEERTVRPMPEDGVRKAAAAGLDGTVFNSYRLGGFLMFRLYPEARLYMDGRNDVYGTFRDEVYNPLLRAEPGWRERWRAEVERHDVRWALLDADAPLASALAGEVGWMRWDTRDEDVVLWVRREETLREESPALEEALP